MRDVAYYLENYPAPAFTFTPDDGVPCLLGREKAAALDGLICSKQFTGDNIIDFTTGEASTMPFRPGNPGCPRRRRGRLFLCGGQYRHLCRGRATPCSWATGRGGHAIHARRHGNAIDLLW